jgi:hypothetical protein
MSQFMVSPDILSLCEYMHGWLLNEFMTCQGAPVRLSTMPVFRPARSSMAFVTVLMHKAVPKFSAIGEAPCTFLSLSLSLWKNTLSMRVKGHLCNLKGNRPVGDCSKQRKRE